MHVRWSTSKKVHNVEKENRMWKYVEAISNATKGVFLEFSIATKTGATVSNVPSAYQFSSLIMLFDFTKFLQNFLYLFYNTKSQCLRNCNHSL